MKIDEIFGKNPALDSLKLDTVLFGDRYPVLFTCTNADEVYMFICCEVNAKTVRWIGTRTSYDTLIGMLSDRITIRDAFLSVAEEKMVVSYDGREVVCDFVPVGEMEDRFLPTVGEFMNADEGEFSEEITAFRERTLRDEYPLPCWSVTYCLKTLWEANTKLAYDPPVPDCSDVVESGFTVFNGRTKEVVCA